MVVCEFPLASGSWKPLFFPDITVCKRQIKQEIRIEIKTWRHTCLILLNAESGGG